MTQDRAAAVRALLASMCDWEPELPTWTGRLVAGQAIRGESPGRVIPCPHCDGGRLADGTTRCRRCWGKGRITVDPQTLHEVAADDDGYDRLIRRRRVRCDVCGGKPGPQGCRGCAGTGSVEVIDERQTDASIRHLRRLELVRAGQDAGEDWLDLALRRKAEQWARGSYPELEVRLGLLASEHPRVHALVVRHLVRQEADLVATDRVADALEWAVDWLEQGMSYPIRVPEEAERWGVRVRESLWRGRSERHAEARQERNHAIRTLHAAGATVDQLTHRFAVGRSRVYEILNNGSSLQATGPAA